MQVNTTNPSAEQYYAWIEAHIGENDPIALQRKAPETLAELIAGVPDETLSRHSAPGKWSIRAILAHLAEDELVTGWRYRQMIENSGVTPAGFDQDQWARLGDYDSWPPEEALEMFRLLRQANLRLFSRLTPAEWQSGGMHAERGPTTVESLARHMAAHDLTKPHQPNSPVAERLTFTPLTAAEPKDNGKDYSGDYRFTRVYAKREGRVANRGSANYADPAVTAAIPRAAVLTGPAKARAERGPRLPVSP